MRRLYMLLPGVDSCRAIVDELRTAGVPDSHLHVVASLTARIDGLPAAGVWQKTEMAHGIEIGTGLGGVAGLLAGLLVVTFPPAGMMVGGGALLAGTAAGAGFGALVSALMKSHEHSHKLEQFQSDIEAGKVLLLVDIPKAEVSATRERILKHHPEANIRIAVPKKP